MNKNLGKIIFPASQRSNIIKFIIIFVLPSYGLVYIGLGLFGHIYMESFRREGIPVQARIVEKRESIDDISVMVEYTVDGKIYREYLNESASSMRIGQQITVYYKKDNPETVRQPYRQVYTWMPFVFIFLGASFIVIDIVVCTILYRSRRKLTHLRDYGTAIDADITDIRVCEWLIIGNYHPITIKCQYTEPSGKTYLFERRTTDYDDKDIDRDKKKIRVLVDRRNPSVYYVDVDSILR